MSSCQYRLNSFGHFDTLSYGFLLNHIMNQRFKILSSLFKLFILMVLIKRWNKSTPWYYFLLFLHVEILFFSWIKTSKLCHCIRPINSNTTFYWSFEFWLLHLNLTYESAFSIWYFSLLEFCCGLFVRLCASLVYISRGTINVA